MKIGIGMGMGMGMGILGRATTCRRLRGGLIFFLYFYIIRFLILPFPTRGGRSSPPNVYQIQVAHFCERRKKKEN